MKAVKLENKTILLISTDPWSSVFLSKHNYAIELAAKKNHVFFLSPPVFRVLKSKKISIAPSGIEGLDIINYDLFFPLFLKFKSPWLFQQLLKWQARRILKKIKKKPDIVWDFNAHPFFYNLKMFGAPVNIVHPVDKISEKVNDRGAHIIFSLSYEILGMIDSQHAPKIFINHGLSKQYAKLVSEGKHIFHNQSLKVCYVGNLMIHSLDHDLLQNIIQQHPDIQFHFIGPYKISGNPLGDVAADKSEEFINFLQKQTNVFLHGLVKSTEVPMRLKEFDVFLVCYKQSRYFSNDNSHKVLEYLSTGKVIVSTYLKQYENSDLIIMSPKEKNSELASLFNKVVKDIYSYNNEHLFCRRVSYALDNTYEKQIERIEHNLSLYSF